MHEIRVRGTLSALLVSYVLYAQFRLLNIYAVQ